jgi:hypothetical protein
MDLIAFNPDSLQSDYAREYTGDEGDAQVDDDAFGNLADGDVHHHPLKTHPSRQDGDKDRGVNRKDKLLKDGVEGRQTGAIFPIAGNR